MDSKMDSLFILVDSKFDAVLGEDHLTRLMLEDHNARSRYVLDSCTSLFDRVRRLENWVFEESM